jgi:hypothetical protein
VFFFRFFRREGKTFVCFVKPCEAALVQEEEEEEKKRGLSDGGKAEGTEKERAAEGGQI